MSNDHPKVLLVEDEPAQREVLKYNLQSEGFDVVAAAVGIVAEQDVARLQSIETVLLDHVPHTVRSRCFGQQQPLRSGRERLDREHQPRPGYCTETESGHGVDQLLR